MITDFAADDAGAAALVLQADGKLAAAGRRIVADQASVALARYASDGALDPIFGAGGRVLDGPEAFGLVVQPEDGRLVTAGDTDGDFTVARYEGDFASLALTNTGTGSGAVTSAPSGIACGGSCFARFLYGTVVSLTATAAPGSVFTGWTGDADCSDGGVTLDGDKACTARFDALARLTVSRGGTGSGSVSSYPAGITCGETCTQSYPSGMVVTLTATPAAGSRFVGWSGDDDCADGSVTMDVDTRCLATFASDLSTLSVVKSGPGSGTVTSTPPGIDCGATCSAAYDRGTTVELTAVPAPGSVFGGWNGCANGMVRLDTNKQCTALFGVNGTDLTGSWVALRKVCRAGGSPCRLKGRFAVKNTGVGRAGASVVKFGLSTDGTVMTTALGQVTVRALGAGQTQMIRVRRPLPGTGTGMFVLGVVDAYEAVAESNEANNVMTSGPLP